MNDKEKLKMNRYFRLASTAAEYYLVVLMIKDGSMSQARLIERYSRVWKDVTISKHEKEIHDARL